MSCECSELGFPDSGSFSELPAMFLTYTHFVLINQSSVCSLLTNINAIFKAWPGRPGGGTMTMAMRTPAMGSSSEGRDEVRL